MRPQRRPKPAEPEPVEVSDKAKLTGFEPPAPAELFDTKTMQELEREKALLEEALVQEWKEMGREDFWFFLVEILFPDVWQENYTEEFHKPICEIVQNLKQGEDLWMFVQREARKSYILDIAHTLWLIVRDADIRVLTVGARRATVIPFARLIRSAFIKGTPGFERFQQVYPEFLLDNDKAQEKQVFQFTVPGRTKPLADPTFRATYLGVTGAGWRCDVLKFDDPIERRNVATPDLSAKSLQQMLDMIPLVQTGSKYKNTIGMGTRWAYHDPYGKVIGEQGMEGEVPEALAEKLQSGKVKVIVRHGFEDPNRTCEHCPKHIVEKWPHGHPVSLLDENGIAPLAPIHTRETLMDSLTKYMVNPALGEALWWHQYQNVCKNPSTQKIRSEWFSLILDIPSWRVPKKKVLVIDSANKDFQKPGVGDYMVALMGDFDEGGRLALRHGLRSNIWTRDEFIRRILAWCQGTGWWPQVVVKEKFGEDAFLTDVQRAFREHFHPVHCVAASRPSYLGTIQKKYDWVVESIQGPLERGDVVFGCAFPRDIWQRIEYEGTNLGQVNNDDTIDALALFFVPGVRVLRPHAAVTLGSGWAPPDMNLYEPGKRPVVPVASPLTVKPRGMDNPGVRAMVDSLGFSNVTWDPQHAPQHLDYKFDE